MNRAILMRFIKPLFLITLGGLVLLGSAGVVFKHYADRDWEALQVRIDAIQAGLDAEGQERAVLYGERNEDEAFEHYLRAIDLAVDFKGPNPKGATLAGILEAPDEEREAYRSFTRQVQPILLELKLGAHASRAELDLDWEGAESNWSSGAPDFPRIFALSARELSRLAFVAFLVELVEGNPEIALDTLLDSLQFARDMAATPSLSEGRCGVALLAPDWFSTFAREGGWSLLPETEMGRWLDALAVVDAELETVGPALRVDTVLSVRGMEAYMRESSTGPFRWNLPAGPLLSLVSAGLKHKTNDAHNLLLDFETEYSAAFESDPLRGPERVLGKYKQLGQFAEGYVEVPLENFDEAMTHRVRWLARFRLLRHALALQAGREDTPETSRLGLPIQSEIVDGTRRVFLRPHCGEDIEVLLPIQ